MSGPIVGKRRLRAELRRLRRERELTQDLVAAEMEWSLSKLIRIENGHALNILGQRASVVESVLLLAQARAAIVV